MTLGRSFNLTCAWGGGDGLDLAEHAEGGEGSVDDEPKVPGIFK